MTHRIHDKAELAARLREIYPELSAHGINLALAFDPAKDAWLVTFSRGDHTLSTFLERKDADGCIAGVQCVYLGVQIAQLIRNFEEG